MANKIEVENDSASLVVPMNLLIVNDDNNPRGKASKDGMVELTADVAKRGVLEPLLVTAPDERGHYTLIAGYRRHAAAKAAKLTSVPVRMIATDGKLDGVKADIRDKANAFVLAIIENEKREDLSVIDRCRAAKRLRDLGMRNSEIVAVFRGANGKELADTTVSNYVRVGSLEAPVLAKMEKLASPMPAGLYVASKGGKTEQTQLDALTAYQAEKGGSSPSNAADNGPADGGTGPAKGPRASKGEAKKSVSAKEIAAIKEYLRSRENWSDAALKQCKVTAKRGQPFADVGIGCTAETLGMLDLFLDSLLHGVKDEKKGPLAFLGIPGTDDEEEESGE